MNKIISIISIILFLNLPHDGMAGKLSLDPNSIQTVIFFNEEDQIGVRAEVKGVVMNIGARETSTAKEREIGRPIQDKTKISVRLNNNDGVIPGGLLYVINERNLVVGKISVLDSFKSKAFYMMCVGYGNFRMAKQDFRVVRRITETSSTDAYLYVARAYREVENKDISKAIEMFQRAIISDKDNPEAHMGLGYVYLEQKLIPFAIKEFDAAYQSKGRVYDKEDRFMLLKGCAETRFNAVFRSELPKGNKIREKYLDEGIKYAKESIAVYDGSAEAHFMLGKFYYDRSTDALTKIETDNDERTVKEMLKVLEIQKDHLDACIILSKVYKKHSNRDKALLYIEMARNIDATNADARELEKTIRNMR
jgi:Tetratricopeptide repeat